MNKIFFSLLIISLLLFRLILTEREDKAIDQQETFDSLLNKRIFANQIENQREYVAVLDKRRRLARIKFEEYCEPKGKILERSCPQIEQCFLTSTTNDQLKRHSLREMLEQKDNAHQFLRTFSGNKRFFLSSLLDKDADYKERNVHERRRKALSSYEDYCESTDRLPRSCPPIDRCKCGECNKK